MPINPAPGHFSTSQYKSILFEAKIACIENIAKIQHRQPNYQSHTCHNCDMFIKTFDLWWLKLSEVPPKTSLYTFCNISRMAGWGYNWPQHLDLIWLMSWWAGFQTGTAGWLCYQGQCQILEVWESVIWILLVVIHSCTLLIDWARPSDS